MCRTIVGVSQALSRTREEKPSFLLFSQFAKGIHQAGGLPMVIPMGDPSWLRTMLKTIDKLILRRPKCRS